MLGVSTRRPCASALLFATTAFIASACGGDAPSVLDPRSDATRQVEVLWWGMLAASVVVVAFVVVVIVAAALRRREPADGIDKRPVPQGERFIVIAGLFVSTVILGGFYIWSLGPLNALSGPPEKPTLTIDVVGHNWWWEVRYPNGAVTANEIHVPVGEPVEMKLVSADIIHSLWVPQLQVKTDLIPGMDNRLWLVAEEAGTYRGQCAEYCGLQHARMEFSVVAQPPDEFQAWLANEARDARDPATAAATRGREVFLGSSCAGCHAVRGTTARGDLGPDLTHLAARETIGAGLLPLTREDLTRFVADAQEDKPGASMPASEVQGAELDALIDYLMELE